MVTEFDWEARDEEALALYNQLQDGPDSEGHWVYGLAFSDGTQQFVGHPSRPIVIQTKLPV